MSGDDATPTPRTDAYGQLPMYAELIDLPLKKSIALSKLCDGWTKHSQKLERELAALREKLSAAENTLTLIVRGRSNDPQFLAAKYWGGYEQFDAAPNQQGSKV